MTIAIVLLLGSLGLIGWLEAQWYLNRQRYLRLSWFWIEVISNIALFIAMFSALYIISSVLK